MSAHYFTVICDSSNRECLSRITKEFMSLSSTDISNSEKSTNRRFGNRSLPCFEYGIYNIDMRDYEKGEVIFSFEASLSEELERFDASLRVFIRNNIDIYSCVVSDSRAGVSFNLTPNGDDITWEEQSLLTVENSKALVSGTFGEGWTGTPQEMITEFGGVVVSHISDANLVVLGKGFADSVRSDARKNRVPIIREEDFSPFLEEDLWV